MQEARRLAFAVVPALAALLAACASPTTPTTPAAPSGGSTAVQQPVAASPAGSGGNTGAVAGGAVASSTVPTVQARPAPAAPAEASVYFGFDEYVLDGEDSAVVERWGRHLVALPTAKLRIEGHTDERGSAEYNLSLGQRRAQAVADALRAYGVAASRLEAVSYGEERPAAPGHDEAAWAKNRRADLRAAAR